MSGPRGRPVTCANVRREGAAWEHRQSDSADSPMGARWPTANWAAGSPLVMLPGWLSHVQKSWSHPSAESARDKLASAHRFIWYDRLGCGLSDRSGFTPSIDNDVHQLEAVLDAGRSRAGEPHRLFMGRTGRSQLRCQIPGSRRPARAVLHVRPRRRARRASEHTRASRRSSAPTGASPRSRWRRSSSRTGAPGT